MITKAYAVDIEVMPDHDKKWVLPDVKASTTLKDPEKIEADIQKKKAAQLDKMGLNPLTGKIICISVSSNDGNTQSIVGAEEKNMIEWLFDTIADADMIFTYNGKKFDFPYIFKRGMEVGAKGCDLVGMKSYTDRFKAHRHIDLMDEFCWFGEYEKLDTLAKVYLGEEKQDIDFKDFPDLMNTIDGQAKIAEYCRNDAILTLKLAVKFGFVTEHEPIF